MIWTALTVTALLSWLPAAQAQGACGGYTAPLASDLSRAVVTEASAAEATKDPLHASKDEVDPKGYDNGRGDNDGDGTRNSSDAFPNDPRNTKDSDGDGVGDTSDAFPNDPKETRDSDCDGVGDNADERFDGVGCVSHAERWSGDGVYGQDVAFDLVTTEDGVIHVTLRVKLSGSRDARREAIWEHWAEAMWSNDGMTLDVQWVEKNPHKTVNVHRGGGRANSGNYYTASDKWVVAHEVGHLLGLHDEYYDGSDPNRLMGEGDALMAYNFDGAKTYPRYHALIKEHFDSAASRPAAVADLPPEHQERWQAPPNPERVACPEGSSEYESVKEAYAEVFCKKDGEKTYLAYTRGSWWEWQEHLDDGSAILEHPTTGERLLVTAADLVPTAPTGTAIEQPDQTEPIRVEPPAKPKLVACPEGSSEYASVKDAYKDLFCQKDGEKTYLANIDGRWWTWDEHLDDGSVLLTNDAGEYRVFGAGDLTPTAPPGTVIEEKEPAVAEPEPEPEPEPEEPAVAEPEEELDDISWDPVVDVEEEPVEEPETATPDEDESVEEEPEEEVTETVWPRPRPGPPRWVREGRPPPPWLRNGDRPGTPRQAESGA